MRTTRYMADKEFQRSASPILAQEIFETVRAKREAGGFGDGKIGWGGNETMKA